MNTKQGLKNERARASLSPTRSRAAYAMAPSRANRVARVTLAALLACAFMEKASAAVSVSVDWRQVRTSIDPLAYGCNAPYPFNDTKTTNLTYQSIMRTAIGTRDGASALMRLHNWGMISSSAGPGNGWLANGAWDAAKIQRTLKPMVDARFNLLINIPSGPAGSSDVTDIPKLAQFCADLVRIVNVSNNFHVVYWEVPNEREGLINAAGMASLVRACSQAMKAVDPTIKVGGPALSWLNESYMTTFVTSALADIDFVTVHTYPGDGTQSNADTYNSAQSLADPVARMKAMLKQKSPGRYIPFWMNEYNAAWQNSVNNSNHIGAVHLALINATVLSNGGDATAYWVDQGWFPFFNTLTDELYLPGRVLQRLNQYFWGQIVTTSTSSATSVVPYATSNGLWQSVMLINRTDTAQTANLSFPGWSRTADWTQYQVSASGYTDATPVTGAAVAAGLTLPANSVTMLVTVSDGVSAPTITTQPTNSTVTVGATVTFTVAATGSPAPTYQWRKGGTNMTGATGASYITPATVIGDNGTIYSVVVSNAVGTVTSSNATLTVIAAPADTTPPTISTLSPVDNATDVALGANLVATFNEAIAIGTGDITLKNLTDATQVDIPVTDVAQVSVAGAVLTINPTANLVFSKNYAVQIAATAIDDLAGNSFAGISDDSIWNFTAANLLPTVSFTPVSASGAENATTVTVTVALSHAYGGTVTVEHLLSTSGGTATPGADFVYVPGTLTFNEGETSKSFTFTVVNDTTVEENETIVFELGALSNATVGSGNIFTYTIQLDTADWYAIPFRENFEARTLGSLNNQFGWLAQDGTVQTNVTFGGSAKAGMVTGDAGYLRHTFNDARTRVWTDMRLQVTYMDALPTPSVGTTAAAYVRSDGRVMVFDGTNSVATSLSVAAGDWARFTIFSDYTANIWVLYVNDVRAGRFGFYTQGATAYTQLRVTGSSTTLDDVAITLDQPPMKYMPSLILLR